MTENTGETEPTREAPALDLLTAARAVVAMTLKEAIKASDAGRSKLYCACDHLNPCWSPGMPITSPLRFWGDPEAGPACDECTLRAAITAATEGAGRG